MNILFGGRLGDMIHGLVVPKYLYDANKIKFNVYMADSGDRFTNGLHKTFKELEPIMAKQGFVDKFEIYKDQKIDINMVRFRKSELLEHCCWSEIYFWEFFKFNGPQIPVDYAWLEWNVEPNHSLVVSRNYVCDLSTDVYNKIIKSHKNAYFIGNKDQYDKCQLKIPFVQCDTLMDLFTHISGADVFLGDQSGPATIACALNKKRIIELNRRAEYYIGEGRYSRNFKWFSNGYLLT